MVIPDKNIQKTEKREKHSPFNQVKRFYNSYIAVFFYSRWASSILMVGS